MNGLNALFPRESYLMPGGGDVYLDWLDISGGTFYFWLKCVCNIFYYTIPKLWAVVSFGEEKYLLKDPEGDILTTANETYREYVRRFVESKLKKGQLTDKGIQGAVSNLRLMFSDFVE